jgi:hypothetical protein
VQVRLRSGGQGRLVERDHHRRNLIQAHRADEIDYSAIATKNALGLLKRCITDFLS